MNSQASITIEIKTQYGQETLVPICDNARIFCDLAGTKTMTRRTLKLVTELGYKINIQQPVRTLESIL